ncbi:MAG: DAK2 domain-containing protein [Ruminococcaceae bacterium]|nr:DAK2 domain-containing protein [Oscillospiraceae bacterium]
MKTIDGKLFGTMVISGANMLENEKETINALNVFPVPDGDTGSNMGMTIGAVREKGEHMHDAIGECALMIADTMLMAARGNSGVILSLFFKGVGKSLKNRKEADSAAIAKAFQNGVESAYSAVMKPKEGTILTVMRVSAEKGSEKAAEEYKDDPVALLTYMQEVAVDTLNQTPEMLPVLKQANVVDAGGAGFVAILDGMIAALNGKCIEFTGESTGTASEANFADFNTEDIKFAYCTECIVSKFDAFKGPGTAGEFRMFLTGLGDSLVFVDDDNIIKIHVHTNDPGYVLSKAVTYGSLVTVKVENMKNQHTSLSRDSMPADINVESEPQPLKKFGFVTVANGEGIADTFRDLGADEVVYGGQTMNPSLESIIRTINYTPAKNVFVLPNNSNIYLTAVQAAKNIKDKKVHVLPTKTIPQGISAMLAFDSTVGAKRNLEAMQGAIEHVCSLAVTYAVHDAEIEGLSIHKDQTLGLVDGKVALTAESELECLEKMSEQMAESEYITIFYGNTVSEEDAAKAEEVVRKVANDRAEIVMIPGKQPVYSYIISCE